MQAKEKSEALNRRVILSIELVQNIGQATVTAQSLERCECAGRPEAEQVKFYLPKTIWIASGFRPVEHPSGDTGHGGKLRLSQAARAIWLTISRVKINVSEYRRHLYDAGGSVTSTA